MDLCILQEHMKYFGFGREGISRNAPSVGNTVLVDAGVFRRFLLLQSIRITSRIIRMASQLCVPLNVRPPDPDCEARGVDQHLSGPAVHVELNQQRSHRPHTVLLLLAGIVSAAASASLLPSRS